MATFDYKTNDKADVQHYGWNHPWLGDMEPMNCDIACQQILDSSKPLEERLALQAVYKKAGHEAFLAGDNSAIENVDVSEAYAPGLTPDDPEVRLLVVSPKNRGNKKLPCVLFFFGGGMILGFPENQIAEQAMYATELGCVIVTPDYRLLPEHAYPAAVDDGEAALNYILAHADELGVDVKRIVTQGQSSGAYMATCVAQRIKKRTDVRLAGQMLLYPILDDTFEFESSKFFYGEVWHASDDQLVFNALLGQDYFRGCIPDDAVPIHCTDFKGMPPTILYTGELDYGHDACMKYAQGIMNEHIFCDLHVWGGCFHGFLSVSAGTDLDEWAWTCVKKDLGLLLSGDCLR